MLAVNERIKNAYNQYTTQRKSKIRVGNNEYFIQNMDLYADAYDEGNIVGNTIAKTLKFDIETQYVRGLDEFELLDGIWTGEEYEYVNLGTFKLFEEQGTDDFFSSITAYDKLILFNKVYNPEATTYPITIYGLLQNICEQAGVTLGTQSIANGDKILNGNVFVEGETLKDVLKAICQISGNFAVISNDTLKLKLQGEDNIVLNKYQLSKPEYKRTTWKVNQVVLGMQDIIGEYVLKQDDEDVELNGVHKIVINNNPFVYNQDLRQSYIDELFDAVKGFGYVAFETNFEGLPYIELGDSLTIDEYESLVLRYELKSPDGLNSMLQAPSIIDSVIDYVNNTDDIDNKQRRTEYRVDKAEGTITQLTQVTTDIRNDINNNYYTITQTNELVQNASTGITNTFSEAGGNNVFRNTGLWFGPDTTTEEKEASSTNGKIEIDDGADNTLSNLKIYGNTSQETTTGKNLNAYPYVDTTKTTNGITWTDNGDGTLTVNGTNSGTATAYFNMTNNNTNPITLPAGTYTASLGSASNVRATIARYDNMTTVIATIPKNKSGKTFTLTEETQLTFILAINKELSVSNVLIKPMIEAGSTATAYEPYTNGPSPNPDYPQEIKTVTGRQEISVSGKNLFDYQDTKAVGTGITTDSDGWITLTYNNTTSSTKYFNYFTDNLNLQTNTNYNVILEVKNVSGAGRIVVYNRDTNDSQFTGSWVLEFSSLSNNSIVNSIGTTKGNFSNSLYGLRTYLAVRPNESGSITFRLSVLADTTVTPSTFVYETFKGENYEINLGKNLYNKSNDTIGKVLASDGSEANTSGFCISEYIAVKPNTTYTISRIYENTSSSEDNMRLGLYTQNKTWIQRVYSSNKPYVYTTPSNCYYVRLSYQYNITNTNVQIEKGSQATSYSEYFTPIELCKIGNYQDRIYKDNGKWYLNKAIGKVVLNGSETISSYGATSLSGSYQATFKITTKATSTDKIVLSDFFTSALLSDRTTKTNIIYTYTDGLLRIATNLTTTMADFKTWLSTHNTIVYYVLKEPTTTEITDTELINQLNSIKTIDGYNLILLASNDVDTEFDITYLIDFTSYEYWTGDLGKIKEEKAANLNALLLQHGTVYQEQQVPNGSYTISFKYKKLINLANVKCIINDVEYELTGTDDTEFTQTIDISTQHIRVTFTSDRQNSCEIYDLMVNAGKVKLAYSQNQNETTTDTVNISKGITITSTDTDTTFKANADGIRTLDRNGNVLTKFTDTGMTTKEMIVEDTSQIVGVLVQQVGDQTWFTRL